MTVSNTCIQAAHKVSQLRSVSTTRVHGPWTRVVETDLKLHVNFTVGVVVTLRPFTPVESTHVPFNTELVQDREGKHQDQDRDQLDRTKSVLSALDSRPRPRARQRVDPITCTCLRPTKQSYYIRT